DGHGQHVLAVEQHRALGHRVFRVAGDRVGEGGLAGPVRAHDRVRLARPDGQVDALEDLVGSALDGHVQVADLQRGHSVLQSYEDVAVLGPRLVHGYGLGGRQAGRLAGAQVEARAVQPALDRVALDLALGQRDVGVRADVADRVDVAAGVHHAHRLAGDVDL